MDSEHPAKTPSEAAIQAEQFQRPKAVDWWAEIKSIAVLLIAVLVFHSFVAKPFYIPSESMMPALLKGDRLVVSKYPYGWSYVSPTIPNPAALFRSVVLRSPGESWGITLPFMKGRLFGRLPKRGDIVIVTPHDSNEDYIKRVIGLPGDLIEVRAGEVILNGTPLEQRTLMPLPVAVDANAPCPTDQFPGAMGMTRDGQRVCELPVKEEYLPGGRHYTIIDVRSSDLDWYGPVRVPPGELFLMGDNRDNSADSRASLAQRGLGGPVSIESIGGRAEFITFSVDGTATLNPLSWWHALRADRAGASLRPAQAEPR